MADLPLSLSDIKQNLDIVRNDQDEMLQGLILAASDWVEGDTGLVLTRRVVTETLAGFGDRLAAWPISSVDAVTYRDTAGVEQTLPAESYWRNAARPARLWTSVWATRGSITVTMTAGYSSAAELPYSIRAAIIVHCREMYQAGLLSAAAQDTLASLCDRFRLVTV